MPLALVEGGSHGLRLTAVNARAWREGLRSGLALTDAHAALPTLLTRPAEPEQDRAALAALASWIGRYGPRRNVEDADGLWVDVTGVAHIYGGEEQLLDDLCTRLTRAGVTAQAGLADTAGAAFALARFAATQATPWRIAAPGATRVCLAALPVEALRLPADGVVLLRRLGLARIGQLYALPRDALAQRFRATAGLSARAGTRRERQAALMAGAVLARLDQALGLVPEPRPPLEEPPPHLARRLFAEPLVSAEGVGAAVATLAHDLASQLEARGQGGTRFTLSLYRADSTAQQVRIGASRPCRDAHHLIALLGERLDSLDAGFGLDAMTLACTHAEPLHAGQIALAGTGAAGAAQTAALIDRLSNRLGADRVVRLAPADSHVPERAQRRMPMLAAPVPKPGGQAWGMAPPRPATGTPPAGPPPGPGRPAFLLRTPEPIAVLAQIPEGPPLRFTWRRLTHRVVRAEGPERIEPEWWRTIGRARQIKDGPSTVQLDRPRDYYTIEDEHGGRYWVFRAGLYGRDDGDAAADADAMRTGTGARAPLPAWFMHGVIG